MRTRSWCGVRLVLAGLEAHRAALPGRVGDALDAFDSVPGPEDAVVGASRS